jgi:hypothetical protein
MDCFQPGAWQSQAVPATDDVVNSKLAYRYFIKGRHAFSAGDLNRATLMFQCALDANPGDSKVKAFLRRAVELKNNSEPVTMGYDRAAMSMSSDRADTHSADLENGSCDVLPLFAQNQNQELQVDQSVIDMAPVLNNNIVFRDFSSTGNESLLNTVADIKLEEDVCTKEKSSSHSQYGHSGSATGDINPLSMASTVAEAYEYRDSWKGQGNSAELENHSDTGHSREKDLKVEPVTDSDPLWCLSPRSPGDMLDAAPDTGSYGELVAGLLAAAGLVFFGFILTL